MRSEEAMPVWLVRATWIEDEVEGSEQWEVSAATAHDVVKEVTIHIRFHPHHVEAKSSLPEDKGRMIDLRPGPSAAHTAAIVSAADLKLDA
jgi:DNA primase